MYTLSKNSAFKIHDPKTDKTERTERSIPRAEDFSTPLSEIYDK